MAHSEAGQLLLTGTPGPELDARTAALFREIQPGGFILFGRNIKSPAQLRKLVDDLRALSEIEPIFPGTTAAYSGIAWEDHWALDPYVMGAYSYYRVGQAATYGAIAAEADGPFRFAGEHTSVENIGFLDGAVATGERAAKEIAALL